MVNPANVKSLLMRLHGEIHVGSSQAGSQASFAQSLGESLAGSMSAVMEKVSEVSAKAPAPSKPEVALPVISQRDEQGDDLAGAVSTGEMEVAKATAQPVLATEPAVERPPRLDADAGEIVAAAANDIGVAAEPTAAPQTSLVEIKGKAGAEKEKTHKRQEASKANETSTNVTAVAEPKMAVIDSSQQAVVVDALQVVPVLPRTEQAAVAAIPSESKSAESKPEEVVPVVVQRVTVASGSVARRSAVLVTETNAGVRESRKSKDTGNADAGDEKTIAGSAGHAHSSSSDEQVKAATPAKAIVAVESVPATAGLAAAQTPVHTVAVGSGDHASVHGAVAKEVSVSDGTQTATEPGDGRAMESRLASTQEHRTLAATPSTLEVGMASGTHGWLKIRAELTDTGTIKAALSSTSTAGQEMLRRELPSLSSFLDQERVQVSSLVVHQAASSGLYAGADSGGGAAGQQPQGESSSTGRQGQPQDLNRIEESVGPDGLLEIQPGDLLTSSGLASGGGWLSVRA